VKIYADGRRVIVWDGKARWQPDSGQFLFNFDVRSVVQKVKLPRAASKPTEDKLTADHWFNLGVELEATSTKEAQRAYHMLAIDPVPAHLNLGKLYHGRRLRKPKRTIRLRERSEDPASLQSGCFDGRFQQPQAAMGAYREGSAGSSFADAHYNLALLFESMGKKPVAAISYMENLSE
jgi:hypothetical protein